MSSHEDNDMDNTNPPTESNSREFRESIANPAAGNGEMNFVPTFEGVNSPYSISSPVDSRPQTRTRTENLPSVGYFEDPANGLLLPLTDPRTDARPRDVCSICWESIDVLAEAEVIVSCNHIYHHVCLHEWFNTCSLTAVYGTCPLDRVRLFITPRGESAIAAREHHRQRFLHLQPFGTNTARRPHRIGQTAITAPNSTAYEAAIEVARQAAEDRNRAIAYRNEALEDRNRAIEDRDRAFQDRNRALQDRNHAFQDRNRAQKDRDRAIEDRNRAIQDRDYVLQERSSAAQQYGNASYHLRASFPSFDYHPRLGATATDEHSNEADAMRWGFGEMSHVLGTLPTPASQPPQSPYTSVPTDRSRSPDNHGLTQAALNHLSGRIEARLAELQSAMNNGLYHEVEQMCTELEELQRCLMRIFEEDRQD